MTSEQIQDLAQNLTEKICEREIDYFFVPNDKDAKKLCQDDLDYLIECINENLCLLQGLQDIEATNASDKPEL